MQSVFNHRACIIVLLLASAMFALPAANAEVLFDNFGTNSDYDASSGINVLGGTSGFGYQRVAGRFVTSAAGGILGTAELPFTYNSGLTGITALVVGESGGVPNVTNVLDTTTLNTTGDGIQTFIFDANVALTGSTPYWLVLKPTVANGNGNGYWHFTTLNVHGTDLSLSENGAWIVNNNPSTAFRISTPVLVVPEAGTFSLVLPALGILGIGVVNRKRSFSKDSLYKK